MFEKQRHRFASEGLYSQSYAFPVVMYRCASCTIKKAEHRRIDAFELWCWRRHLRGVSKEIEPVNPKGNQPWIFIGRTDDDLKLQYFGHLIWRVDSLDTPWCWERWRARGEAGNRGWDGWMASWTQWTWVWANSGRWWRTGRPGVLLSMGSLELDRTEQLNNSCGIKYGGSSKNQK